MFPLFEKDILEARHFHLFLPHGLILGRNHNESYFISPTWLGKGKNSIPTANQSPHSEYALHLHFPLPLGHITSLISTKTLITLLGVGNRKCIFFWKNKIQQLKKIFITFILYQNKKKSSVRHSSTHMKEMNVCFHINLTHLYSGPTDGPF